LLTEDTYGRRKRLEFVASAVRVEKPARILDIGCGTGANLTLPLAKLHSDVHILGVDIDAKSINYARKADHPGNVRFATLEDLQEKDAFDLVIASEVLEHVENPPEFLDHLIELARPGGRLLVTVPNGYGPFEWCAFLEALLHLSGMQAVLRRVKRIVIRMPAPDGEGAAPTFAVSPHINFFSRRSLLNLFDAAGLRVKRFQPTTFLCGYGLDSIIRSRKAIAWNAAVADRLPAWCASDWMFELETGNARLEGKWRSNGWGRFRRRLNRRRWRVT
jgi:SAM-dependent methyltransferase